MVCYLEDCDFDDSVSTSYCWLWLSWLFGGYAYKFYLKRPFDRGDSCCRPLCVVFPPVSSLMPNIRAPLTSYEYVFVFSVNSCEQYPCPRLPTNGRSNQAASGSTVMITRYMLQTTPNNAAVAAVFCRAAFGVRIKKSRTKWCFPSRRWIMVIL